MAAPTKISDLIRRYERVRGQQAQTLDGAKYLRQLFGHLGWKDEKKAAFGEGAQIVSEAALHAITSNGPNAARDRRPPAYSLRVNDERKCFVATFEPSNDSAFHLRRYAWSANLPISILSNFEELRVYDGLCRPQQGDSADTALIERFEYKDYENRWEHINRLLSTSVLEKDDVESKAPGTFKRLPVDDAFLYEMDGWRWDLAKSIDQQNPGISLEMLNAAVQHTMNCILFLRICEDRGIEPYGTLRRISENTNVFEKLKTQFAIADTSYNAGLFRLNQSVVGATFAIEDNILRRIIDHLYFPVSPYEFSVISVEMLGQVYERFLGNIITRSNSGGIAVEQKPEVRKSGGVYYTPPKIVKTLVQSTVGKLCEGKTPDEVSQLRVLDPSCGSGSFLNAAYQYLLDWHLKYYLQRGENSREHIRKGAGGEWRLSAEQRKKILLNNIFGVDLDSQAVEIAKLSLLLKAQEGEGVKYGPRQALIVKERLLPSLDRNIQCGNSLIGPDFEEQRAQLSTAEQALYQPFDFAKQFPTAFNREQPGFDAVIGNPPYLSYAGRQAIPLPDPVRNYFSTAYKSFQWRCAHALFMERSIAFLSRKYVAFIVPDAVGKLPSYGNLRELLLRHSKLAEVRYWGDGVFKGVTMPTLTFVADREFNGPTTILREDKRPYTKALKGDALWNVSLAETLLNRISARSFFLGPLVADLRTVAGEGKQIVLSWPTNLPNAIPVLEGKDIQRYQCSAPRRAIDPNSLHRSKIEHAKPRYEGAQFLIRNTADRLIVGPRRHTTYFRNSLLALYAPDPWPDLKYIVAIMNSRLMHFVWQEQVPEARQKTHPQVKVAPLREIRFLKLDPNIPEDKAFHDEIVRNAGEILELYEALPNCIFGEQERMRQRIQFLDDHLDRLIDRLYGLSDQETADIKQSLGIPGVSDKELAELESAPDEPDALINFSSDTLWERLRREPQNQMWRACLQELVGRRDPGLAAFIATRLEMHALNPESQKALIFAALDTQCFEPKVRAKLCENLLSHARKLKNSGNEETLSAALRRAAAMIPAQDASVLLDFLQDGDHPDTKFTALECIQNIFLVDFPEPSPALQVLRPRVRQIFATTLAEIANHTSTSSPSTMAVLITKASICAAAALLDPHLLELSSRLSATREPYLKRGVSRFLKELESSWHQRHPTMFEGEAQATLTDALKVLQNRPAALNSTGAPSPQATSTANAEERTVS